MGGMWTVCKQLTSVWSVWVDVRGRGGDPLGSCRLLVSLIPGAPSSISHDSVFS